MRISVIAVGTRMPDWVEQGITEYTKRLPRELKLNWREIPVAKRGKDVASPLACAAEGEQILRAVPATERVIALDVRGKRIATEELARQLEVWQMSGDNFKEAILRCFEFRTLGADAVWMEVSLF